MKRSLIIGIVALGVFAGACGDNSDDGATAATTTTTAETTTTQTTAEATTTTTTAETTTTASSDVVVVAVSGSELGEILTDGNGSTLYLFVPDEQGDSVCYDDCAAAWPPLTGAFEAGDGVNDSLLGVAARTDGAEQVTYNGWPLYYFAPDTAAGETKGQGVNEVWYVVDAAGAGIGLQAASVVVTVSESELGEILTDGDGNTLYLFVPDEQGDSVCYDDCAAAWPPLTGGFEAGAGVDPSLLSVIVRTDGAEQVTYNGWPLYYFARDAAAGETNGQGLNEVWYVVDATGEAIS